MLVDADVTVVVVVGVVVADDVFGVGVVGEEGEVVRAIFVVF